MQESLQNSTGYSSRSQGQYRVITAMEIAADEDRSELPEVYRPCKGTWAEFKGDVSAFFTKLRGEIIDRYEGVRDLVKSRSRRNKQVHRNGR